MPRVRNLVLRNSPEQRIRSVSAAYTLTMHDDDILLVNTTAASRTITLPALADAYDAQLGVGKTFYVQKIAAANNMVIDGAGAETINGAATQTIGSQFAAVKLVAGPTEWTMLSSGSISTADLADNAVTNAKMADNSVDSAEIVAGAIDTAHIADGQITPVKESSGFRLLTADAALTLAATDKTIELNITTGTTVATMTATHAGHRVSVSAGVRSGGAYTLACTRGATSGSVTLDAAGEGCELVYSGSAWRLVALTGGATFA